MLPRTLLLLLTVTIEFALCGCYEVLTHQDENVDETWMEWDGTVQITPESLELAAAPGSPATAELTVRETSTKGGAEMTLALEGEGTERISLYPGMWSVAVVPSGELVLQVTFAPEDGDTGGVAELVITNSGTPAQIRVPITTVVAQP